MKAVYDDHKVQLQDSLKCRVCGAEFNCKVCKLQPTCEPTDDECRRGFDAWREHVAGIEAGETMGPDHVRHVICKDGTNTMMLKYDPLREKILTRTWNGVEEQILHLDVETTESAAEEFKSITLFGLEAMRLSG